MLDRLLGPLAAIVRALTARVDYCALYRAKVISQSADLLTVDVQPTAVDPLTGNPRMPGLTAVPLRAPAPGATVVASGFVLVGFEDGDPRQPYALPAWDASASVQPAARKTDPTDTGTLSLTFNPGTGGATLVAAIYAPGAVVPLPITGETQLKLPGKISGGSSTVNFP